ncbi:MAG TPA: aldo/keto reductase [Candidatus Acidoferrum sp.]|nr:aldo/keto reductase [Candidatus Acidoferrum sp.]
MPHSTRIPENTNQPNSPAAIDSAVSRREFLEIAVAATCAVGTEKLSWAAGATGTDGRALDGSLGEVPYRSLGRTGARVSAIGLGGYHLGNPKDVQESIRIIRAALDSGINFLDNCWDYHDGDSEVRMGKALRDGYRQRAFLMTKIDGHTRKAAAQQLEESLRRLQTDHLDLLQFHENIRMDDSDRIFASGGGMEAVVEAQKAGKVRYIGFTGHKDPEIHLKMLQVAAAHQFHFDAVQMPLNVMDAHFHSFEKKVVPVAVREGIGILGMKPMGAGVILESKTVEPIECLHYAMNLPTSVVITGCESMENLAQALKAAKTFRPLEAAEVAAMLAKTDAAARNGEFELYKTSTQFDGTAHNPQWLG